MAEKNALGLEGIIQCVLDRKYIILDKSMDSQADCHLPSSLTLNK